MKRYVSLAITGLAVALLLALAYSGIVGGVDQFDQTSHSEYTVGQIIQTVLQLVFGVLSVAVIAVWFWARHWRRPVVIAWVVSVGLAGGLAPVVWSRSSAAVGIIAGIASALVAGGIAALLRVSTPRQVELPK